MELTEKEKQILLRIINNAQGQGVNFLFGYEGRLLSEQKPSKEITLWYEETKQEFMELEKIKKRLTYK